MKIPFSHLDSTEKFRLLTVALWSVVGVSVIYIGIIALSAGWGNDTPHFWSAARTLLNGQDPYKELGAFSDVQFEPGEQFHPLPWVAILFIPLGILPFPVALPVWTIINLLFLGISFLYIWRLCRNRLPPWSIPLICILVILLSVHCIECGQLGIMVSLCILAGYFHASNGQPLRGGLLYSLAIIKPWIAVGAIAAVILVALRRGQYRVLAGLISGAIFIILGTTLAWPTWLASYPKVDFSQAFGDKVGGQYAVYWPVTTIFDYTKYILGLPQTPIITMIQIVLITTAALLLIYLAYRAWLRNLVDDQFFIGAGTMIGPLVVPYIRYYDYAFLAVWCIGVFTTAMTTKFTNRFPKIIIIILMALSLSLRLGSHLEPWMFQLVVAFYLITIVVLINIQPAPKLTEAPTPLLLPPA